MPRIARWLLETAKWSGIGIAGLLAIVLVAGNAYRLYVRHDIEKDTPPAPGKLVSIGTHRMHIYCEGSGQPVVILDAGGGGTVTAWALVMEQAKSIARVCAFDRSGLGWSERSPVATSPSTRAADLHALLAASGEPGPYIFAGHSLGGEQAWLYAQDHLEQAAGLITVDSVPPNAVAVGMGTSEDGATDTTENIFESLGLRPLFMYLRTRFVPPYSNFPDDAKHIVVRRAALPPTDDPVFAFIQIADRMADIGDLPLVVISHGQPGLLMRAFGDRAAEAEDLWQAGQAQLSTLSSHGKLVVATNSDHVIPTNDPGVVVAAIDELVQEFRMAHP